MRRASKIDATHQAIRETLIACGFTVLDTFRFPGFVDMMVRKDGSDKIFLIEAKTPQNKQGRYEKTEKQAKLEADGWEIVYLTSASEALAWAKEAA